MSGENDASLFPITDKALDFEIRRLREHVRTPAGTIVRYPGTTVPEGWKRCDGSRLERIDYPQLAHILGEMEDFFFLPHGADFFTTDMTPDTVIPVAEPTNKLWIDGRRIYRSIHYESALPDAAEVDYTHNIDGIRLPVSVTGFGFNSSSMIPVGHSFLEAYLRDSYTELRVTTTIDLSGYEGYFIIEYTKNIDAPNEEYIIKL